MDLQNVENFSGRLDADNRAALQVTPLDDYQTGPILILGLCQSHIRERSVTSAREGLDEV